MYPVNFGCAVKVRMNARVMPVALFVSVRTVIETKLLDVNLLMSDGYLLKI
jgi:hypothetical protein